MPFIRSQTCVKRLAQRTDAFKPSETKETKDAVAEFEKKIDAIDKGTKRAPGFGPVNRDLSRIMFSVESADMRPADTVRSSAEQSCKALEKDLEDWRRFNEQDVAGFNKFLVANKQAPLLPVVTGIGSGCKTVELWTAVMRKVEMRTFHLLMRLHFVTMICCTALFEQSTIATTASTFHISGTMTQCGKAVPNLWVTFEGKASKTVKVNAAGVYEADLPLGVWTATATIPPAPLAETADYRGMSRPRRFRVIRPSSLVLNIYLPPPVMCDLHIATPGGRPATPEEIAAHDTACYGEEFFSAPSADGTQFEVILGGLEQSSEPCSIEGANKSAREFATYNLLSVQADKIVYRPDERVLAASGDVVIEDESGEHRAHSITFHIQDGQAVPIRKDRLR